MERKLRDIFEVSVKDLQNFGFSPLNKKHYNIRLKYGNTEIKILNVFINISNKSILLDFYVKPTFLGRKNMDGKVVKDIKYINRYGVVNSSKFRKYYNIKILYYDLNEFFIELKEMVYEYDKDEIRKWLRDRLYKILYFWDSIKIWANDLSFLMQGTWKILDGMGMSLYKFPVGLIDKGIWLRRHDNAGLHLTKHLIGVFDLLRKNLGFIINKIIKYLNL